MPDIDGSLRGADGSYQPPSAATSSAPLPASPHDPTRRPGKEAEEVPSTRQPESVSSGWAEVMGESLNAMDSGSKRWDEIAFPGAPPRQHPRGPSQSGKWAWAPRGCTALFFLWLPRKGNFCSK